MRPTGTIYNDYAYLAECQMATLSGLCMKKSSTKGDLKRHTSLAMEALMTCVRYEDKIKWESGPHKFFGRVKDLIDASRGEGEEVGVKVTALKVALADQKLEWGRLR